MSKPAKKSAKGKKDKKKDDAEPELTEKQQITFLLRQLESLQHQLVFESAKAANATTEAAEIRKRLLDLKDDSEKAKQRTFDISTDMSRQYQSMRGQMLQRVDQLEIHIQDRKQQFETLKQEFDAMVKEKDKKIAEKDAEIRDLIQSKKDMAAEFCRLLNMTSEKLQERIVITNEWDAHPGTMEPVVKTFEDFTLGMTFKKVD